MKQTTSKLSSLKQTFYFAHTFCVSIVQKARGCISDLHGAGWGWRVLFQDGFSLLRVALRISDLPVSISLPPHHLPHLDLGSSQHCNLRVAEFLTRQLRIPRVLRGTARSCKASYDLTLENPGITSTTFYF